MFWNPLAGLLLMPLAAAALVSSYSILWNFSSQWRLLWPLGAGGAAYLLFQWAFREPLGLYVFGHELTHALAAVLSGFRVSSLRAAPTGGEVRLSGTNLGVALAPYCFPLYTGIVLFIYAIVRHYAKLEAPPLWVPLAVGFTYAFHVALTWRALLQRQPDLAHGGPFLSLILILLANVAAVLLMLKILFPSEISLGGFAAAVWMNLRRGLGKAVHAVYFLKSRMSAG